MGKILSKIRSKINLRIITRIVSLVLIICVSLGVTGSILSYRSAVTALEKSLTETATIMSMLIESSLDKYTSVLKEATKDDRIFSSPDIKTKQSIVDSIKSNNDWIYSLECTDSKGKNIFTGKDYSSDKYFTATQDKTTHVFDPILLDETGAYHIIISVPVVSNGTFKGAFIATLQHNAINDVVNSISVGEKGTAHILNKTGTVIAYPDESQVGKLSSIRQSETDKSLNALADIDRHIIAGETGFEKYTYNGV